MAENKGIEIEFRGQTTAFDAAVKKINGELKQTKSEIGLLNKELKFDPKNVEALTKKFDMLRQKEKELSELTKTLKAGLDQMNPNDKNWSKYNKTLQATTLELKQIQQELQNTSVASVKLSQIGDNLKDWGKNLESVGGKLENVGKKLSVVSAGIVGMATAGIKFNAQLEQYQVAFTTLIGDADKAAEAISNIQADASATPFSTEALIEANQYLLAAGIEAGEARETILALGDAIAATGGGSNELSRMAQNLQQIKNVGKATSVDIKQFANAGINIYGLLADYTGKTTKQVQNMTVSYDVLNKALQAAASEGGKYFGAMDNQSQTLNGQISSLKDSISQLLGELTVDLLPIVKDVLTYIRDFIQRMKEMSPEQKGLVERIAAIGAALGPVLTIIGKVIFFIGEISSKIGAILKSEKLLGFIAKLTANGSSLGAVLKSVWAVVKGFINPITAIIGLLAVLYAKNENVRNAINGIAQAMMDHAAVAFNIIKDVVTIIITLFGRLFDAIKTAWDKFKETQWAKDLETVLLTILGLIEGLIDGFKGLLEWVEKGIKWFGELLGITMDVDTSIGQINKGARTAGFNPELMSGGYMSGGMMSSPSYTFNNTFTLNGVGMTRESANRFADMMTQRINENLGRMV